MHLFRRPGSPFYWVDATIDGVRLRKSTRCTSEREARRIAIDLIAAAQQPRSTTDRAGWRLRQALGAYWQDHAKHRRGATTVFAQLERISDLIGPDTPLSDLSAARLIAFRADLRGSIHNAGARAIGATTVNRYLAALRAALYHARDVHDQPIPAIQWQKVMARENPHRIRYASADEFRRMLASADPALRPILIAAVTTGLRRTALLSIRWHQVDLDGRVITLPRSKGGRAHAVRIVEPLRAALGVLAAERDARASEAETLAERRAIAAGPVFDTTNLRRRWQQARAAAGIEDLRFHDLRHTAATWALLGGATLKEIQAMLDHAEITTTMRYLHAEGSVETTPFDRAAAMLTAQSTAQSAKR